jgi:hypothetical protein
LNVLIEDFGARLGALLKFLPDWVPDTANPQNAPGGPPPR